MKQALGRGKAETERTISDGNSTLRSLDAEKPRKSFRMAFISFILGPLSLLFASSKPGLVGRSIFVFLPAFFSIYLGVKVMRVVRPYRDHRLAVGLAIVGIIAGLISGFGLISSIM